MRGLDFQGRRRNVLTVSIKVAMEIGFGNVGFATAFADTLFVALHGESCDGDDRN